MCHLVQYIKKGKDKKILAYILYYLIFLTILYNLHDIK